MTEYDVGVTLQVMIKADSKQEAENIAIKNIQNCLEPYYIEADTDAQPVKWLMELKDLKAEQNDQYVFIHELMSKLKEAKRLLKAAVEYIEDGDCDYCAYNNDAECPAADIGCGFKWIHADEALKLIGNEPNGI